MKIVVVGIGYVGLLNVVFFVQNYEVIVVDILESCVQMVNVCQCLIVDVELEQFLFEKDLNLYVIINFVLVYVDVDYVIVVILMNYDFKINFFDILNVEVVIEQVLVVNIQVMIVIKLIILVGYVNDLWEWFEIIQVIFSFEFLCEGCVFYDNLYLSCIIVGE